TPIEVAIVFPDRMHVSVQTPQGALTIVFSPDAGFMSAEGRGVRELPAEQKADSLTQILHDPVYLLQHVNDPAITFSASGTEKIGDVEAAIVDVGGAVLGFAGTLTLRPAAFCGRTTRAWDGRVHSRARLSSATGEPRTA